MASGIPKEFVAKSPQQRKALSSVIRLEILGHFLSPTGDSVADVAERMGRPPGALYYHIDILERTGLLTRVGTRKRGKRDEALYRPAGRKIVLEATDQPADAVKALQSAFRMAERDFEAAIADGTARPTGKAPNLRAGRMHFRVSKKTLTEINKQFDAIMSILDREGRRKEVPADADQYCSITLALMPLRGRDND